MVVLLSGLDLFDRQESYLSNDHLCIEWQCKYYFTLISTNFAFVTMTHNTLVSLRISYYLLLSLY